MRDWAVGDVPRGSQFVRQRAARSSVFTREQVRPEGSFAEARRLGRTMAQSLPRYPSLYQINTTVRLREIASVIGRPATLDDLPDDELDGLAEKRL